MLRTAQSLPLCRALNAGLRPGPFPDRAASLLPGLLAATRTGLTPAGDDELLSDQVISTNHLQRWAHSLAAVNSPRLRLPVVVSLGGAHLLVGRWLASLV